MTRTDNKVVEDKKRKGNFYCFDETDNFGNSLNYTVHGKFGSGNHRAISLALRPCVPRQRTEFNKNETCLIDDVKNRT